MQTAAAGLHFERAAKIKAFVMQLSQLGRAQFRHVRLLRDFQFLSVQPGPRAMTAKVLLISPGRIEEILGLTGAAAVRPAQVLASALERIERPEVQRMHDTGSYSDANLHFGAMRPAPHPSPEYQGRGKTRSGAPRQSQPAVLPARSIPREPSGSVS